MKSQGWFRVVFRWYILLKYDPKFQEKILVVGIEV
jgi:hypothetical protein